MEIAAHEHLQVTSLPPRSSAKPDLLKQTQKRAHKQVSQLLDSIEDVYQLQELRDEMDQSALHYAAFLDDTDSIRMIFDTARVLMQREHKLCQQELRMRQKEMRRYGTIEDQEIFEEWLEVEEQRLCRNLQVS